MLTSFTLAAPADDPGFDQLLIGKDGGFFASGSVGREIRSYDIDNHIVARHEFEHAPNGMALSRNRLVVATGQGTGRLHQLDAQSLKPMKTIDCGHSPFAPSFSADGKRLAVAQRFLGEIWIYDAETLARVHVWPVGREPIDLAWKNDHELVVLHHLSDQPAMAEWTGGFITRLDTRDGSRVRVQLEDGSGGLRELALTPDGRHALAASVVASHRIPATQIEQGWINKNGLMVVDLENNTLLGTLLLDEVTLGAGNPWAITVGADRAWIGLAGTHQVMSVDYPALIQHLHALTPEARENFTYDLRAGRMWKHRIDLQGRGPRALALDETNRSLLVASYFNNAIEEARLDTMKVKPRIAPSIIAGNRRGEFLFHDATVSFQNWMSCSSCHPDARTDTFNWDLENDGLGTPRQAKTMLFTHQTPPTTVTGIRPNAEYSVRAGIAFLRAMLPDADAAAIDGYLKSLRPVPSPHLVNGQLGADALAGKALFHGKASCVNCHSGTYRTVMKPRWVGTGLDDERDMKYDVPSLREAWRTAPYIHDGRAPTIRDVLTTFNPEGHHGGAAKLTEKELEQLIEYVKTL